MYCRKRIYTLWFAKPLTIIPQASRYRCFACLAPRYRNVRHAVLFPPLYRICRPPGALYCSHTSAPRRLKRPIAQPQEKLRRGARRSISWRMVPHLCMVKCMTRTHIVLGTAWRRRVREHGSRYRRSQSLSFMPHIGSHIDAYLSWDDLTFMSRAVSWKLPSLRDFLRRRTSSSSSLRPMMSSNSFLLIFA